MKRINVISLVILSFFLTISELELNAQNSSGWRGEHRNGTIAGFNVPDIWPDELKMEWQINVGECDASPLFYDGKIYLHVKQVNEERLLCLNASDGKNVWSTSLNPAPEVTGPAAGHPGPRSTPSISKGKIFTLGAGGIVNCLDTQSGSILWTNKSYTEVPAFFTASSPLVVNKLCIVQLGGSDNGVVVAFDVNSGQEMWKLEHIPCTYSSPVLMDTFEDLLLVQSETDLLGVSTKGELLWKIATPVQGRSTNSPTPIYEGNTLIVTGQGSGTKAFSLNNSGTGWEYKEVWSNTELGTSFNTPLIKNGFLFGSEERLGKLFCLNMKTGEKTWMDETTLNRFASTLDLGKVLISLPANGLLIAYEPDGSKYTELARYKVSETEVYAHPLLVEDEIYVKGKEMLSCWSLK